MPAVNRVPSNGTTLPRLHRSTVYIETIVRPEAALYHQNATPPDFKFIMFGRRVASVAIISGRKTRGACMAWVDEAYERWEVRRGPVYPSATPPVRASPLTSPPDRLATRE